MSSIRLPQRPAFSLLHPSYLVVSTYQLDSAADSRAGSLHFLSAQLESLHVHSTPAGVFRFVFPSSSVCVSALTDGSIYSTNMSDFTSSSFSVSEKMLLDVSCHGDNALCTDNNGHAHYVNTDTSTIVTSWLAHKLPFTSEPCEVWTCCLHDDMACTGGEDALLRLWDVRTAVSVGVAKLFEAGVTYSRWMDSHTLLTGSYDQKIRLIDTRNMKESIKEIETAGGVWHVETSSHDDTVRHLAACMYGGWALFDEDFQPLASDEKAGEQLLYGAAMLSANRLAYSTFNDYTVTAADIHY